MRALYHIYVTAGGFDRGAVVSNMIAYCLPVACVCVLAELF